VDGGVEHDDSLPEQVQSVSGEAGGGDGEEYVSPWPTGVCAGWGGTACLSTGPSGSSLSQPVHASSCPRQLMLAYACPCLPMLPMPMLIDASHAFHASQRLPMLATDDDDEILKYPLPLQ
jgi:hypothetical protein